MLYDTVSENINSNTNYKVYNNAGAFGLVAEGEPVPNGAEVVATDVSGSAIEQKARSHSESMCENITEPEENAQAQKQKMSEEYYNYLTNGNSSNSNSCAR